MGNLIGQSAMSALIGSKVHHVPPRFDLSFDQDSLGPRLLVQGSPGVLVGPRLPCSKPGWTQTSS